jgi:hypothetical protein
MKSARYRVIDGHWVPRWNVDPYWRIYLNFTAGAIIETPMHTYDVAPEQVIILPCWQPFRGTLTGSVEHTWLEFSTPQWSQSMAQKYFGAVDRAAGRRCKLCALATDFSCPARI